jgi:2'-5' RNA ligase
MRIFVALNINKDTLSSITEKLNALKENHHYFRWIYSEYLHITLAFFHELDDQGINILKRVIEKSIQDIKPIQFSAEELITIPPGLWRNKDHEYILPIAPANGIALKINIGKEQITKLAGNIEDNLIELGNAENYAFRPKEKRPFYPHITLARKGRKDIHLEYEEYYQKYNIEGVLNQVIIYKSEIFTGNPNRRHKEYPKYTYLFEYELK